MRLGGGKAEGAVGLEGVQRARSNRGDDLEGELDGKGDDLHTEQDNENKDKPKPR